MVATVSNGVVTALALGETTITVKIGSYTDSCVITVTESTDFPRLNLSHDSTKVKQNGSVTVYADIKFRGESVDDIPTITWATESSDITLRDNQDGSVTVLAGDILLTDVLVTATATYMGKTVTAGFMVNVVELVDFVLEKDETNLFTYAYDENYKTSETLAYELIVNGILVENATLSWASDTPAVATVASDGTVTAVSVGQAKITATYVSEGGKTFTDSCWINVSIPEITLSAVQHFTNGSSGITQAVAGTATLVKDGDNNITSACTITANSVTIPKATLDGMSFGKHEIVIETESVKYTLPVWTRENDNLLFNYSANNSEWNSIAPNLTIERDVDDDTLYHITGGGAGSSGQSNTVSIDVTGKGENRYLVFDAYIAVAQANRVGAVLQIVGVNGYYDNLNAQYIPFMAYTNSTLASGNSNLCWSMPAAWTTVCIDLQADMINFNVGSGGGDGTMAGVTADMAIDNVLLTMGFGNATVDTWITDIHFVNEVLTEGSGRTGVPGDSGEMGGGTGGNPDVGEPNPNGDPIFNYTVGNGTAANGVNQGWYAYETDRFVLQSPELTIAKESVTDVAGYTGDAFHMTGGGQGSWGQNNTISIDVTGKGENRYLVFDAYVAVAQTGRAGGLIDIVGMNGYWDNTTTGTQSINCIPYYGATANSSNLKNVWITAGTWTTVYIDLDALEGLLGTAAGDIESVLVGLGWGNATVDTYIANIHFANELPA